MRAPMKVNGERFAWSIHMGTLGGFPYPPAMVRRRQSRRAPHADNNMGTLGGFAPPFGPPPATTSPLASLGLAIPCDGSPQA